MIDGIWLISRLCISQTITTRHRLTTLSHCSFFRASTSESSQEQRALQPFFCVFHTCFSPLVSQYRKTPVNGTHRLIKPISNTIAFRPLERFSGRWPKQGDDHMRKGIILSCLPLVVWNRFPFQRKSHIRYICYYC